MKRKIYLIALLFTIAIHAFAVNPPITYIGRYKFAYTIVIQACKSFNDTTSIPYTVPTLVGQQFDVIYVDPNANLAIIRIIDYKKRGNANSPLFSVYNMYPYGLSGPMGVQTKGQIYFRIKISDLIQYAIKDDKIKTSMALGVMYVPFKYRLQPHDQNYDGPFNFGAAIGLTWAHKSWRTWNIATVVGISLANIQLDTSSVRQNAELLTKTNNFGAISLSVGAVFQFEKVQAGIFMGCDRLSNNNDKTFDWKYQGTPWISIGFGYSIFSPQNSTPNTNSTQ